MKESASVIALLLVFLLYGAAPYNGPQFEKVRDVFDEEWEQAFEGSSNSNDSVTKRTTSDQNEALEVEAKILRDFFDQEWDQAFQKTNSSEQISTTQKKQLSSREEDQTMNELYMTKFLIGSNNTKRKTPLIDAGSQFFTGRHSKKMITAIHVVLPNYGHKNELPKCIGFSYGDVTDNCEELYNNKKYFVYNHTLQKDDYITEVSGYGKNAISKIQFKTRKNNIFGPYGRVVSFQTRTYPFNVSNGGSPLLYAQGVFGRYPYNLTLVFLGRIEPVANLVAKRIFTASQENPHDFIKMNGEFMGMFSEAAEKMCLTDTVACEMDLLVQQVTIINNGFAGYLLHLPRNLLPLESYDSSAYVKRLQEAKKIHHVLSAITINANNIIDATEEQSQQISNYFKTNAENEKNIANNQLKFIKGLLEKKKKGASEVSSRVKKRLTQILGVGVALAAANVADKLLKLATVIGDNINPIRFMMGMTNFSGILKAIEEVVTAARTLIKLSVLLGYLNDFAQLIRDIAHNFAKNRAQIDAMRNVIDVLMNEADQSIVIETAKKFVTMYGNFEVYVNAQHVAYATTLLGAVGNAACTIMNGMKGLLNDIVIIAYDSATLDCIYFPADIAKLGSYFQNIFSLQMEARQTLVQIVRSQVADTMAGKIGVSEVKLDIRKIAMATVLSESLYQLIALQRCDVMEYRDGAVRPDVCTSLIMEDSDIGKLADFVGASTPSERNIFAYIPSTNQTEDDMQYINISTLIQGEWLTLNLPIQNKEWLKEYHWIPESYDRETAFYITSIEMYIPGLKCNESEERDPAVRVEMMSANPTSLYSEPAVPTYLVPNHKVTFEYTENSEFCPGDKISFPLLNDPALSPTVQKQLCVVSHGKIDPKSKVDFAYPSLFAYWTIKIVSGSKSCTLTLDEDLLPHQYMVPFRVKVREVQVKKHPLDTGIDECWPEGSRCLQTQTCVDETLSYRCRNTTEPEVPPIQ